MRRLPLVLIAFAAVLNLTGCPGSSRSGKGGPMLYDGTYQPVVPDAQTGEGLIPGDLETDATHPPLPCGIDDDCPPGWHCHPGKNVCVECYEDGHCGEGSICLHNICVEQPECDFQTPCPPGMVCDYKLGLCVQCVEDEDCPEGFECEDHLCEETKPWCEKQEDCPEGLWCNLHSNECVACLEDGHCQESQWCDLEEGECQDDLCVPGAAVCVTGGFKVCRENGGGYGETVVCPPGTACQDGECIPVTVCVPGESYCVSTTAFKVCADDGATWENIPCDPEQVCQDSGDGHAKCVDECTPVCHAQPNSCGPDEAGCFTLCDSCQPGYSCPEGTMGMPPGTYVPCVTTCSCEGKECGDDGCGNLCGKCQAGFTCQAGVCVYSGYTCAQGWECISSCSAFPNDACVKGCVEGTAQGAQALLLELIDCVQAYCGGQVTPGCAQEVVKTACAKPAEACFQCQPDCWGKECGEDGCGGSCGQCQAGAACQNGKCIGEGSCQGIIECIENSSSPPDVSVPLCMAQATPAAQNVFIKLATCVEETCGAFQPMSTCYYTAIQSQCATFYKECISCIPSCLGKECGSDGCGGWCGFCEPGSPCVNGKCQCVPDCKNKECGPDGCGNLCGKCQPGYDCSAWGKCQCTPDCVGKECGSNGCGGSCGICLPEIEYCTDSGSCIPYDCKPGMMECDGNSPLICAGNGEWISLGPCPNGSYCLKGACQPWVCQPGTTKCEGNGVATCAANGAGWLPAELCPAGTKCQAGKCVPVTGCGDIPLVGCCDGNLLMVCAEDGAISVQDCGPAGCGWMPWGVYGCGGAGADPSGKYPQACPGTCQPQCSGKQCGPDGCGGVCGTCKPDSTCISGKCELLCLPSCQGKLCGSDGCGGSCGVCTGGQLCTNGKCVVPPTCSAMVDCAAGCWTMGDSCFALCSQGADQSSENYVEFKTVWKCAVEKCAAASDPSCFKSALMGSCYQQYLACISCVPQCANKKCGPDGCGGSCGSCPAGQECDGGLCKTVCTPNCAGKECGSNGCGGVCGLCKPGYECDGSKCVVICTPQCLGKECGSDTCGGVCGYCPPGLECSPTGQCLPLSFCGDGLCEATIGENCQGCPQDCGPCTDGCQAANYPGCGGCKCEQCVCSMDPFCCQYQWDDLCVQECTQCGGCCQANCTGKQCGPDGCGGSCGSCKTGFACKNGQCEVLCTPDCDGKQCGSDDCGGTCGTCPVTQTCKNNVCFAGKSCGQLVECSLGCVQQMGAECLFDCLEQGTPEAQEEFFALIQCVLGQCGLNVTVSCMTSAMNGLCKQQYNKCMQCTPDCAGKQCGPDGCGGTCGTCQSGFYCDNYKCKAVCTPSCVGKVCGSNGCGGSCGTCADTEECVSGKCVPLCVPSCAGKQCGDDGCGGLCGNCPPGYVCQWGWCSPVGPVCGDGMCSYWEGEDCKSCPSDCGPCGDGCVTTNYPGCNGCQCEECVCAMDSYCCQSAWDGLCVQECYDCGGCGACQPQCENQECGDDGCGGSCGTCPKGYSCKNGACVPTCLPSCMGKQCGSDGCGGSCGTCPSGFKCDNFLCAPVCVPNCSGKKCGPDGCNGICGLCGPDEVCLSGQCKTAWDCETLLNCLWDCPEDDETCTNNCWMKASEEAKDQYIQIWECVLEVCGPEPKEPCPGQAILSGPCKDEFNACLNCTPSCTGKQCGPDGCKGSCGECPPGYECSVYGYCNCIPSCEGKECGSDGCGGTCGECADGYLCNLWGWCVCMPQCIGKECGADGCGGSCGSCAPGYTCQLGKCQIQCVPQCVGSDGSLKECGSDGCGGVCGYCPPGLTCTAQGKCQQTGPVCGDAKCASGETCYSCPTDCGSCKGDCCQPHGGIGCENAKVTACVCEMDPYCCQSSWDSICADEAANQCGANCGCTPACSGKQCGSDGCGGSCGSCPTGYTCNALGQCTCVASCAGKQCGSDGCGGVCGYCPPNSWCDYDGKCVVICQPQCTGKQCGPDGCGGSCGSCQAGSSCNAQGQCVCVPNCTNKECGSDGCGGSCGQCGPYQSCTASGKCKYVTPLCGDGNCMAFLGEDCDVCPQDCGVCCGNGACEAKYLETCSSCPLDCGTCCGNNFCEAQYGETCSTCPQDCGPCPAACGDGKCEADKGETCKNCPQDCGPCPSTCGDGKCDQNENCVTCAKDCGNCQGSCCVANSTIGCQDAKVQECVCAMDDYCCSVVWDAICAGEADQCGSCNGDCCVANPTPGCDDEGIEECVCKSYPECCTGSWNPDCAVLVTKLNCGICVVQPVCGDGICNGKETCQSCPGDCGKCCGNGMCESQYGESCSSCSIDCGPCCIPQCAGKQCGSDGCGGSCGTCKTGYTCNSQGQCVQQSGLSCSQILSCATNCGNDVTCMLSCNNQGSPEGQQLFLALFGCVVQACSIPPSTQCMIQSFLTTCSSQYKACAAK